jgi:DNA polymerase-3 subunit gamma/tau
METIELYRKYRPRKFSDCVGLEKETKVLAKLLKKGFPHALLLTGPSGNGKTTLARILVKKLKCSFQDFTEINAASSRGIDTVREIASNCKKSPWGGDARVWLLDEAHQLTSEAADGLLKVLEEPPDHAYFILATTNPHKLKTTIHTRCIEVKVPLMSRDNLEFLVTDIAKREGRALSEVVLSKLIDRAEGSARKALQCLQTIISIELEEEQMEALERSLGARQGFELAQLLMKPAKGSWGKAREIISNLEQDAEATRKIILGYASSVMLSRNTASYDRAMAILTSFSDNYFENGKAGLIHDCYSLLK